MPGLGCCGLGRHLAVLYKLGGHLGAAEIRASSSSSSCLALLLLLQSPLPGLLEGILLLGLAAWLLLLLLL